MHSHRRLATAGDHASGSLDAPLLIPGDDEALLESRTSGAFGRTAFSSRGPVCSVRHHLEVGPLSQCVDVVAGAVLLDNSGLVRPDGREPHACASSWWRASPSRTFAQGRAVSRGFKMNVVRRPKGAQL